MFFMRKGDRYGVTLFTGPNYLTLWLTLAGGERDPACDVTQVPDPRCPAIDAQEVRAAILAGVDEANARFNTRLHPVQVTFVMEYPSEGLLRDAAFRIVERWATVGPDGYCSAVQPADQANGHFD